MSGAAEAARSPAASVGARLMAHMMAFFPDRDASLEVSRGLAAGGADYLEVQFPFSDPSADGSLIQTAGTMALEAGFTVDQGLELVGEIVAATGLPVFIMSYGNLVFRRRSSRFVEEAKAAGARGLIVPDLPPAYDERLYAAGAELGVDVVPVVAPSVTGPRLSRIAQEHPRFLYAALRLGITGSYTEIGAANVEFLERLAPLGADIIAGFGISSPEQVRRLAPYVHALVVGSAFVKTVLEAIEAGRIRDLKGMMERRAGELLGRSVPGEEPPLE